MFCWREMQKTNKRRRARSAGSSLTKAAHQWVSANKGRVSSGTEEQVQVWRTSRLGKPFQPRRRMWRHSPRFKFKLIQVNHLITTFQLGQWPQCSRLMHGEVFTEPPNERLVWGVFLYFAFVVFKQQFNSTGVQSGVAFSLSHTHCPTNWCWLGHQTVNTSSYYPNAEANGCGQEEGQRVFNPPQRGSMKPLQNLFLCFHVF